MYTIDTLVIADIENMQKHTVRQCFIQEKDYITSNLFYLGLNVM